MKERPIIFSADMVRAILEGRKTQTRRVIKPQPLLCEGHTPNWQGQILDWIGYKYSNREHWFCHTCGIGLRAIDEFSSHGIICPYGQVGDRLWLKETWASGKRYDHLKPSEIPDTAKIYFIDKLIHSEGGYSLFTEMGKVRSSMFMCEWMSRITLEITEIRVERVQEITNEDAKAEGITPMVCCLPGAYHYIKPFEELWDSINAKRGYGWEVNPRVWPVSFRKID